MIDDIIKQLEDTYKVYTFNFKLFDGRDVYQLNLYENSPYSVNQYKLFSDKEMQRMCIKNGI